MLPQALHTWRGAVQEAAAERVKLRKAAKRMQARMLAAAFSTWEDHATQAQHMRRRELIAQAHRERRLLRVTLRAWQMLALGRQRHHSKTVMLSIMQRLQQRGLAAAFQGWRENVQEVVRERRLLARSTARFQRRLLSASFARFREAAQSQRRGKQLVARCLARARNHLLAQVHLQIAFCPSWVFGPDIVCHPALCLVLQSAWQRPARDAAAMQRRCCSRPLMW